MSQQKINLFYSPQVKTSITKKFGEKKKSRVDLNQYFLS